MKQALLPVPISPMMPYFNYTPRIYWSRYNVMGEACRAYGGEERRIQGFVGET
jgi:hypothetical protein